MTIAALTLLATTAPAQKVAELPVFEFKGFQAGKTYNQGFAETQKACSRAGTIVDCFFPETPVAGWKTRFNISFAENRLLSIELTGSRYGLVDTLGAFTEKYGKPCATAPSEFINRLGGRIPIQTWTWCFKTGKLTLRERGRELDLWTAEYLDETVRVTPPRGKVDF